MSMDWTTFSVHCMISVVVGFAFLWLGRAIGGAMQARQSRNAHAPNAQPQGQQRVAGEERISRHARGKSPGASSRHHSLSAHPRRTNSFNAWHAVVVNKIDMRSLGVVERMCKLDRAWGQYWKRRQPSTGVVVVRNLQHGMWEMPNIEAQENEPLHVVINRLDKCVHRQLGDLAELCEEPGDLVEVEGVLRRLRHLYRMVELKKLKKLNHTERAEILWKEILHTQGKPHHVGLAYYNQDTKWVRAIRVALVALMLLCQVLNASAHGDTYTYTQQCDACEEGTYCFQNVLSDCPSHSTSDPLSSVIGDCVCLPGYKADANHNCSPCVSGEYCVNEQVFLCADISANMVSGQMSTQASDCVCAAGFTWDGSQCQPCAPGAFKANSGNEACTQCSAGTYNPDAGATSAEACQTCPANSESAQGASALTNCQCSAGSSGPDGGPCVLCAAGTFKPSPGSAPCTDCADHVSSASGASDAGGSGARRRILTTYAAPLPHADSVYYSATVGSVTFANCATCPANSRVLQGGVSGASIDDCACAEGYTGSAGVCAACGAGTYKSDPGTGPCVDCVPGTYNEMLAAPSADRCLACPALSSTSSAASTALTDCQCVPGASGVNGAACTACAPGHVSPGFSNNVVCSACAVGSYENDATNTCESCPGTSTTTLDGRASVESCACPPGEEPVDPAALGAALQCVACPAGSNKTAISNNACELCAADTFSSAPGASLCARCPAYSTTSGVAGSSSLYACVCNEGFETIIVSNALSHCMPCADGHISVTSSTNFAQLTADDETPNPVTDYTTHTCSSCSAGQFVSANQCVDCPGNSGSAIPLASAGSCICDAGHTCIPNTYYTKSIGTYAEGQNAGYHYFTFDSTGFVSTTNAAGRTATSTALAVLEFPLNKAVLVDWSQTGSAVPYCKIAVSTAGTVMQAPTQFEATVLQDSVLQQTRIVLQSSTREFYLTCDDASQNFVGSPITITACPCLPCAAGYRKAEAGNECTCVSAYSGWCMECLVSGNEDYACSKCAAGEKSSALYGSTSCESCAAGKFSASATAECVTCESVRSGSTTLTAGMTDASDCECDVGFEPSYVYDASVASVTDPAQVTDVICQACQASHYKDAVGNAECVECDAPLAHTLAGAVQASDCAPCTASQFYNRSVANIPVLLGTGTIYVDKIIPECAACANPNCECPAGAFGDGTVLCTDCAAGKYKDSAGSQECTQCPAPYAGTSALAATTFADACMLCAQNEYATSTGCVGCPPNSQSPAESGSLSDCACNAGYTAVLFDGDLSSCEACGEGHYKDSEGTAACEECGLGSYAASKGQALCDACPDVSVQFEDDPRSAVESCVCPAGYYQKNYAQAAQSNCVLCPQGSFAEDIGSYSCTKCQAGSYFSKTGSGHSVDECLSCPANSQSAYGAFLVGQCVCNDGHKRVDNTCAPCAANETEVSDICVPCPTHSSHDHVASSDVEDCNCHAGYYRVYAENGVSFTCQICPEDQYCASNVNNTCPANTNTRGLTGRAAITDCVCAAGFYIPGFDGDSGTETGPSGVNIETQACEPCPANSFCDNNDINACPHDSSAIEFSAAISDCVCDRGFKRVNDACVACSDTEICGGVQYTHVLTLQTSIDDVPTASSLQNNVDFFFSDTAEAKVSGVVTSLATTTTVASESIFINARFLNDVESAANFITSASISVQKNNVLVSLDVDLQQISPQKAITEIKKIVRDYYGWGYLSAAELDAVVRVTSKSGNNNSVVVASTPPPPPAPPPPPPTSTYRRLFSFLSNDEPAKPTQPAASAPAPSFSQRTLRHVLGFLDDVQDAVPDDSSTETLDFYEAHVEIDGMSAQQLPSSSSVFIVDRSALQQATESTLASHVPVVQTPSMETSLKIDITQNADNVVSSEALRTIDLNVKQSVAVSSEVQASDVVSDASVTSTATVVSLEESARTSVQASTDDSDDSSDSSDSGVSESTGIQSLSYALASSSGEVSSMQMSTTSVQSVTTQQCATGAQCVEEAYCESCDCATLGRFCYPDVGTHGCTSVERECQDCPTGSFCPDKLNAVACQAYATTLSTGSTAASDCVCAAGYAKIVGSTACDGCGAGSSVPGHVDAYCPLGDNANACADVDANLGQAVALSDTAEGCMCKAGYYRVHARDLCKPCPRDYYCPQVPAANAAQNPQHFFVYIFKCPAFSITMHEGAIGREDCVCAVGFKTNFAEGSEASCMECNENEVCSGQSLNPEAESSVFTCDEGRVPNDDHSACVCAPGYTCSDSSFCTCTLCPSGHVKPDAGNHACEACGHNTYSLDSTRNCEPCPVNTEALLAANAACTCKVPYISDGSECLPCGIGEFYSAASGDVSARCKPCPQYSTNLNEPLQPGLQVCVCDAGYSRVAESAQTDDNLCEACSEGTFEHEGVCVPCGAGSTSSVGSTQWTDCVCGTSAPADPASRYLWDFHDDSNYVPACHGSTQTSNIVCSPCDPGEAKPQVDRESTCVPCEQGKYSVANAAAVCDNCVVNKNTQTIGHDHAGACMCIAGYEMHACPDLLYSCNDACELCPILDDTSTTVDNFPFDLVSSGYTGDVPAGFNPSAEVIIDLEKETYIGTVIINAGVTNFDVFTSKDNTVWSECMNRDCASALARYVRITPNSGFIRVAQMTIAQGTHALNCGNLARSCGNDCDQNVEGCLEHAGGSLVHLTDGYPPMDIDHEAENGHVLVCADQASEPYADLELGNLAYVTTVKLYVDTDAMLNSERQYDTQSVHVSSALTNTADAYVQCTLVDDQATGSDTFYVSSDQVHKTNVYAILTFDCEHHVAHHIRVSRTCDGEYATQIDANLFEIEVYGHIDVPEHAWFPCRECATGYAKNALGNALCEPCGFGFFADATGSLECTTCTGNAATNADARETAQIASTHESQCVCAAGRGFDSGDDDSKNANTCYDCVQGSYKDFKGTAVCLLCGVTSNKPGETVNLQNHYGSAISTDQANHCQPCPAHSGQDPDAIGYDKILMDDITDCVCFSGRYDSRGALDADAGPDCVPCGSYQFKLGYGNGYAGSDAVCAYCADKYYFTLANSECQQCGIPQEDSLSTIHRNTYNEYLEAQYLPAVNTWGVDVADCQCNFGFFRIPNTDAASLATVPYHCRACSPGTHKDTLASWTCTECVRGTYTDSAGKEDCIGCPANSYTFAARSDHIDRCVCIAGYELVNSDSGPECRQCVKGKFRPDPFHADSALTHECDTSGLYVRADCALCGDCADGFYQDKTGQAQCTQCPQHATSSDPARNDVRACQCKGGYGVGDGEAALTSTVSVSGYVFDDSTCAMCATGKYSAEFNYDFTLDSVAVTFSQKVCVDCPSDMSTPEAFAGDTDANPVLPAVLHDGPSDCLCNPGFEPKTYSASSPQYVTECEACPLGKYKDFLGNAACLDCGILDEVTTDGVGATSFDQCQCDAARGFFESPETPSAPSAPSAP